MGGKPTADHYARAIIAAALAFGDDPMAAMASWRAPCKSGKRRALMPAAEALAEAFGLGRKSVGSRLGVNADHINRQRVKYGPRYEQAYRAALAALAALGASAPAAKAQAPIAAAAAPADFPPPGGMSPKATKGAEPTRPVEALKPPSQPAVAPPPPPRSAVPLPQSLPRQGEDRPIRAPAWRGNDTGPQGLPKDAEPIGAGEPAIYLGHDADLVAECMRYGGFPVMNLNGPGPLLLDQHGHRWTGEVISG